MTRFVVTTWSLALLIVLAGCKDEAPATHDAGPSADGQPELEGGPGDGSLTPPGDGAATDGQPTDGLPSDAAAPPPDPGAYVVDPRSLIVTSDGTRSLGDPKKAPSNDTRDQGSKLVYVDVDKGDNKSAEVYWWDGKQIVDSDGKAQDTSGQAYGSDPLEPNLDAIKPFAALSGLSGDPRIVTQQATGLPALPDGSADKRWAFAGLAGAYPDWFLLRRGQTHTKFDKLFAGGRSEAEPMVVAAYGPMKDGRAVVAPEDKDPFNGHNWGKPESWLHLAVFSLELRAGFYYLNAHKAKSFAGGPVTAYVEDCYWPGRKGGILVYPPAKTTFRRCIITHCWRPDAHNQGYFTSGFVNQVTFDEVILYRNGYKTDPRVDPDPRRDIFSRNIYQGGGAQMGHTYRNIISADGASGGPQMRLGATIENSLVIEGYWFSATQSNDNVNQWLASDGQQGSSAMVRNNVQLVFGYPSPNDPDTHGASDDRAQPANGYTMQGATFGATVEGNIVSGAMLEDELGREPKRHGFNISFNIHDYPNGPHAQANNVFKDNIAYRVGTGLNLGGDATDAKNNEVTGNVFVSSKAPVADGPDTLTSKAQLSVDNNRFYSDQPLPSAPWLGAGNTIKPRSDAKKTEGWSDPDRTLKRYVLEVLKLELLDWADDPFLDKAEVALRVKVNEAYDPTGLKTFMAVATRMRQGGTTAIPSSGKPDPTADYPWDLRFTAVAVVNWIRAGFGLPSVK